MIQIGDAPETFGMPGLERPTILIRSGLTGEDMEGVYGTLYWLKSLIRAVPYACPYLQPLLRRYRLAWIPLVSDWPLSLGWRRPQEPKVSYGAPIDVSKLAAVIDVTAHERQRCTVSVAAEPGFESRVDNHLPELWRAVFAGRYLARFSRAGDSMSDRGSLEWRFDDEALEVERAGDAFSGPLHESAAKSNVDRVRITVPGSVGNSVCNSVWRTDRVATLLELVVGLKCGLIAMNRRCEPLEVPIPPKVGDDGGLSVVRATPTPGQLETQRISASGGREFRLDPGHAVVWFDGY